MLKDYEIVKEKVTKIKFNHDGNLNYNNDNYKCFLRDKNNNVISSQYECMLDLGDDHFAVCNIDYDIKYLMNNASVDDMYYDLLHKNYDIISDLKWGVIRINRNKRGKIIPNSESMIVPCLYDRVSDNNLKTATVYYNGKLSYLDIDVDSENYGQHLVPCILEHAVPFDLKYEGFAECSVNGIIGYLPRNCKKLESIKGEDLLTENQAFYLSNYLKGEKGIYIGNPTVGNYFKLTGILLPNKQSKISEQDVKKLRKTLR